MLAVALLVPGVVPVLANDNLSGLPADLTGSITIDFDRADENGTENDGLVGETAGQTIRIQRVELKNPNIGPTQTDLGNPAWIEANTTRIGDFRDEVVDANGVVVFDELEQGIWVVEHRVSGAATLFFSNFLVGLPRNVDENYQLDVEVFPKLGIGILQGATQSVVQHFDNIVGWRYGVDFLGKPESIDNLYVVDVLDARLELNPNTPVTASFRPTNNVLPLVNLTIDTHFELEASDPEDGRQIIKMSLTAAGVAAIVDGTGFIDGTLNFQLETMTTIEDDAYLGVISGNALWRFNRDGDGFSVDTHFNPANDTWTSGYGVTPAVAASFTAFGLNVLQLNVASRQPLAGATFEIYRQVTTGGESVEVAAGTNVNVVPLRNADGSPMTLTTDENGVLQFNGIHSAHIATEEATFWLRQTVAPNGYRTIREWMDVTVIQANAGVRDSDLNVDATGDGYIVPVNVFNEVAGGWVLPETGGVGTIVLTVAGVILISGSLFLFIGNKKEDVA